MTLFELQIALEPPCIWGVKKHFYNVLILDEGSMGNIVIFLDFDDRNE